MSEKYKVQYSNQSKLGLDQGMKGLDLENVHIHFMAYSLTGKDLRFMSKIEPGIFITGGTARAMALKEICHIPETEITTSTDIDWLTLGNRHIYIRQQKLIDSQRTITFRPDMVQTLAEYCDGTAFGVDGLFVGRFYQYEAPSIYLTHTSDQSYTGRYIDFSPHYKGVERNENNEVAHIINHKDAFRAVLLGLRLGKYGFVNKLDIALIKKSLNQNWGHLSEDGIILDYASRAKHDGLLNEYLDALRGFGFTLPDMILQFIDSHTRSQVVDQVQKIQGIRHI